MTDSSAGPGCVERPFHEPGSFDPGSLESVIEGLPVFPILMNNTPFGMRT